jgi:hypothetical protein
VGGYRPREEATEMKPTRFVFLVIAMSLLLSGKGVLATPMAWGDDVKGIPRWPILKQINIYIEANPRSAFIKEGMSRWAGVDFMDVTFNIVIGPVPDPEPDNLVRVEYKPAGTEMPGVKDLKLNGNKGIAAPNVEVQPDGTGVITGATVYIQNALPFGTDAEKDFLRNLGQHEITHVLGLADDTDGVVTDHEQGSTPNEYNEQDLKEIY